MSIQHIVIYINDEKPEDLELLNLLTEKKSKKKKFIYDAVFKHQEDVETIRRLTIENENLKNILIELNEANSSNVALLNEMQDFLANYKDVLSPKLPIFSSLIDKPKKANKLKEAAPVSDLETAIENIQNALEPEEDTEPEPITYPTYNTIEAVPGEELSPHFIEMIKSHSEPEINNIPESSYSFNLKEIDPKWKEAIQKTVMTYGHKFFISGTRMPHPDDIYSFHIDNKTVQIGYYADEIDGELCEAHMLLSNTDNINLVEMYKNDISNYRKILEHRKAILL